MASKMCVINLTYNIVHIAARTTSTIAREGGTTFRVIITCSVIIVRFAERKKERKVSVRTVSKIYYKLN